MRFIKTITAITVLLSLSLSLFSCTDDRFGEIEDVDIQEGVSTETVKGNSDFSSVKTDLGYSWKHENIGRAMLSLPYPSAWTLIKNTDYDISFSAPEDDPYLSGCRIYFHSTLQAEEVINADNIISHFDMQILSDRFPYKGKYVTLLPTSQPEKFVVDTRLSEPEYNLQLSYKDWDADVRISGSEKTDNEMYHQTTSFYWKGFPCILTGLCPEKDAGKLDSLLMYMLSNASCISDTLSDTETVTVFEESSGLTFPISPLYEMHSIDPGPAEDAVMFSCPSDSGTGYSQSFLVIYELSSSDFHINESTFEKKVLSPLLKCTIGTDRISGYMSSEDGSVVFGKDKTDELIYSFTVENMQNMPEGLFYGQNWEIDIYPVSHKEKTFLVCLLSTYDGQMFAFDLIKLMAENISYR